MQFPHLLKSLRENWVVPPTRRWFCWPSRSWALPEAWPYRPTELQPPSSLSPVTGGYIFMKP